MSSIPLINEQVSRQSSDTQTGVSWGVAAFLLVNTALGAGMLNYPYAYNQIGGVLAAALIQVVLLIFIASTMFILVYCADINQDDSYHDVLLSMCGKRAQQISAFSIFLTCYGINVTFLVIIGDQYDRIFNSLLSDYLGFWFLDRKFTIFLTAVLFIWPMCYAKRLDFLKHASILGLFAMLYVAFLTVYEHYKLDESTIAAIIANGAEQQTNQTSSTSILTKSVKWFEPLAIVPVLCFAYQTHEVIVPVYACMKQRSMGHFMKASIFGLIILFLLYNLVGAYGYLTFGTNVGADIMSLYDAKDPVVVIGVVALVIKFITTYPPLMFCGRGALDGLYGEFRKLSTEEFKSSERVRRIVISTIWFFSTVALAVFAPDISVTLQLLGSMASINVFVFPGMCLISLTRRLRRARMALLIEDLQDNSQQQQKAKDYYLISGSYFSAMKKNASASSYNQQFTATFASLMEFENRQQQSRHIRRQEEFEKLITNGSYSSNHMEQYGTLASNGWPINDSFDDYSDCDNRRQRCDMISPILKANNHVIQSNTNNNRDLSIDRSIGFTNNNKNHHAYHHHHQHHQNHQTQQEQRLQSSWNNNKSITNSILERLGSSIAPSTVAQIGISRCTATGLYLFSALIIIFGTFIFVLELVTVFGII